MTSRSPIESVCNKAYGL